MSEQLEQLEQQVLELEELFASVPVRIGATIQETSGDDNFIVTGCNCLETGDDNVTCAQCTDGASRAYLMDINVLDGCCDDANGLKQLTHQGGCIWRTQNFNCEESPNVFWELEITGAETATLTLDWDGTSGLVYKSDDFACRFTNRFTLDRCSGLVIPEICSFGGSVSGPSVPGVICVRVPQKILVNCVEGICEVSEKLTATLTENNNGCPCAHGDTWDLIYDEDDDNWKGNGLFGSCGGTPFSLTLTAIEAEAGCFRLNISCGDTFRVEDTLNCDPFIATFVWDSVSAGENAHGCCRVDEGVLDFTISITE